MNAAPTVTRSLLRLAPALCAFLVLSCSSADPKVNMTGSLSTPLQVQLNNWVRRQPPQVYVRPNLSPASPPTALMIPLRITQEIRDPATLSRNISRFFWQIWLNQQPFSVLEYASDAQLYEPERALALGRHRGADLVVGGYITHYLDGGQSGSSSVSMSIEIWECATGNLLWSLGQAGLLEYQSAHDFYLFSARTRMPMDPPSAVIQTLAADMGKLVRDWAHNVPPEKRLLDGVFSPRAF
ncbi:MAG: hypothetical protein LBH94_01080 [Deltaproteobacteria bacterium]|jgi:hypothetical protein|nr:hypothetical protein [Deltaproteobacteria bacterium]